MQLNELRITSDDELEAWKKTWDGVSIPPTYVQEYMQQKRVEMHNRYNRFVKSIQNVNK